MQRVIQDIRVIQATLVTQVTLGIQVIPVIRAAALWGLTLADRRVL